MRRETIGRLLTIGVLAGLAGGAAEVAWIALYSAATGSDAAAVGRGVTETIGIGTAPTVVGGLAIHMAIAAMLGIAVAAALAPMQLQGARLYSALIWTLAAVWAVNFMIVLPLLNPAFVDIVPLGVSFTSKLLFGIAAAACLQFGGRVARAAA